MSISPITLKDNDTGATYTLEFDRDAVRRAEENGFSLSDLGRYPSKTYDFFHYAFYMHHSRDFATHKLSRRKTDELLDAIGGPLEAPAGLWERLGELYAAAYSTLGDEKNSRVTVTF